MTTKQDEDAGLKQRDDDARMAQMYPSRSMRKLREEERGGAKRSASADLGLRQHADRNALQSKQTSEREKLRSSQEHEKSTYLASSRPLPHDLDKRQKAAKSGLTERHESERSQMAKKHLVERDRSRTAGRG